MYAKRLRTFRKIGFSLWDGEDTTKQIANAIYDSENYVEIFEQNLVEAEKKMPGIILCVSKVIRLRQNYWR